jgi:O-antigen/teichoic acid export membrane protein
MTLPILLLGAGQYRAYSLTQTIPLLIHIILLASALYGLTRANVAIAAQLLYWLSMVIVGTFLIAFRNFQWCFESKMFSSYIHYSFSMWPLVIFQFGLTKLPVLIGNQYLNSESLGYYMLACNLSEALFVLYNSITPIVFNKTISIESNPEFVPRSIRFSNILLLLVALVICLTGKPIFTLLFGDSFNTSWTFLLKLLPWVLFQGMTSILLNYLIAAEKHKIVSSIQFTALVVLILAGMSLCSHFGMNGLCIAMLCSSLTAFFLAFLAIRFRTLQKLELMSLFTPVRQDWQDIRRLIEILKKK